jgi:hypothetical protein
LLIPNPKVIYGFSFTNEEDIAARNTGSLIDLSTEEGMDMLAFLFIFCTEFKGYRPDEIRPVREENL